MTVAVATAPHATPHAGGGHDEEESGELEMVILNLTADHAELLESDPDHTASECAKTWVWLGKPRLGAAPTVISTETYVRVPISESEVYRNMDPQRWDDCGKYWPAGSTYLANLEVNSDCQITGASPKTSPPSPGSLYVEEKLFEKFVCSAQGCPWTCRVPWCRKLRDCRPGSAACRPDALSIHVARAPVGGVLWKTRVKQSKRQAVACDALIHAPSAGGVSNSEAVWRAGCA